MRLIKKLAAAFFEALYHFIGALFCYIKMAAHALKAHIFDRAAVYHLFMKAYVNIRKLFAALFTGKGHLSTSLPI